jgi:hypothetical protein
MPSRILGYRLMPSHNEIATWAAIFPLFCAFVCLPICHALQAGLASARDPAHRATLLSAWTFFQRTYRRKTRWWRVAWLGGAAAYVIWRVLSLKSMYYSIDWHLSPHVIAGRDLTKQLLDPMAWAEWPSWVFRTLHALSEFPASLFGLSFLFVAACYLWAPRCSSKFTLLPLALATALTLYAPVLFAVHVFLPPNLCHIEFVSPPRSIVTRIDIDPSFRGPKLFFSSLHPLLALPLCWYAYWVVVRLCRRQGDKWFRFEE